jgi:hypothetical protein
VFIMRTSCSGVLYVLAPSALLSPTINAIPKNEYAEYAEYAVPL